MNIVRISPLTFCIHLEWAAYPVNTYKYDPRSDIREWAKDNVMKTWTMRGIYVSFKSNKDAMMFTLRWC